MSTTDSRERFEKWAKSAGFDVSPESDGNYKARDTYHAWIAWQAALSAQAPSVAVVDLEALALEWERIAGGLAGVASKHEMDAMKGCSYDLRNLIKANSHE